MSEPHKDRGICIHWQIHCVKIVQMMAWEYFAVPLGTMYETSFLNCSLPYFTEFVIISNSHLEVAYHLQQKHSMFTRCDNNRICQDKAKARQGSAEEISFQTSSLTSPASLRALPERGPTTHDFPDWFPHKGDPSPRLERSCGISWPGLCTNDWKIMILGCAMALTQTLCSSSLIPWLPKVPCLVLDRKNEQSTSLAVHWAHVVLENSRYRVIPLSSPRKAPQNWRYSQWDFRSNQSVAGDCQPLGIALI